MGSNTVHREIRVRFLSRCVFQILSLPETTSFCWLASLPSRVAIKNVAGTLWGTVRCHRAHLPVACAIFHDQMMPPPPWSLSFSLFLFPPWPRKRRYNNISTSSPQVIFTRNWVPPLLSYHRRQRLEMHHFIRLWASVWIDTSAGITELRPAELFKFYTLSRKNHHIFTCGGISSRSKIGLKWATPYRLLLSSSWSFNSLDSFRPRAEYTRKPLWRYHARRMARAKSPVSRFHARK